MSRYFKQRLVWSLLRATQELTYIPPPDRGAFSATERNVTSVLSNEGRTLAGVNFSAFSATPIDTTILQGGSYVVEFHVDVLTSFMTIGMAAASTLSTSNVSFYPGYRSDTSGATWSVGDVLAIVRSATSIAFFRNGIFVSATGADASYAYFFAATSSSNNAQLTCEPELDLMVFTTEYQQYVDGGTLMGWAVAPVAPDGSPAAPAPAPAPSMAPALFDSSRVTSGTLSTDDTTLSATGAAAAAELQGTLMYDTRNDAAYVAEFTVAALGSPMSIGIYAEYGSFDSYTLQSAGLSFYNADGTYQVGPGYFNYVQSTYVPPVTGTSTPWVAGDKLAVVVFITNGRQSFAFFRNGVLVASAFDPTNLPPFRAAVTFTAGSGGASVSVLCDKTAVTYASVYTAYVAAGITDPTTSTTYTPPLSSWPAADVQQALAQNVVVQAYSTTAGAGKGMTFVVGVDGRLAAPITVTPVTSGSSTFSPSAILLDDGTRSSTLTITGTAAGTESITFTNNGGLTNPAATTITITPPPPTLVSGASPTIVSGAAYAIISYLVNVPANANNLAITAVVAAGQPSTYVLAAYPAYTYQFAGQVVADSSGPQVINVASPSAGTWEIYLEGFGDFTGLQLSVVVT